jgi:hypothetical protein
MKKLIALAAVAVSLFAVQQASAAERSQTCDRACLYGILDKYLAALKARDPSRAPFAPGVRNTENNVALKLGDGLWGTIQGLGDYDLRFADVNTGGIGFYGVVREGETDAPFGLRLKVRGGKITEVETIVARPQDAGIPFVNAKLESRPIMNEVLKPEDRPSREELIKAANGYFDTLQRNDGTLHVEFTDDCNRHEDGFQTTNNPEAVDKYGFIMGLGCAAQFKTGYFRFDDALRSRRMLVIDRERGLIMAAAFIDHSGHLDEYKLTDGRTIPSMIRRPNSLCLLETFKVKHGKIEGIEAMFVTTPYRMTSPWVSAGFHYE